jgi:predicted RNA binding protein YcfA (HicA-like mRNA interferase family)
MTALPVVTSRQLIRALERAGFFLHHITGSHHFLRHPTRPGLVVVPYHSRDLKRGTLRSILKQAGLSADELIRLL